MLIPATEHTPLIRTDFSSDEQWQRVVQAASAESPDGFRANLHLVNDRSFADADPVELAESSGAGRDHILLIVADRSTMSNSQMPLLCIDPTQPGRQFRVVPDQLWGVENNLSLANMDFAEFAAAVDKDGVFRGFRN